ncbi:MAG: hypothetical protein IKL37_03525 [Alphaproteobacteria bacterium]|nr:hypothetical protein [Alphaproteobacteria bacterium]
MIIIAASQKTAKTLPRLLCRKWRHVAPIVTHNKELILYQFTHTFRHATPIKIKRRDIAILKKHGWLFIPLPHAQTQADITQIRAMTCVSFTKCVIGIKNLSIQTPGQLIAKAQQMQKRKSV